LKSEPSLILNPGDLAHFLEVAAHLLGLVKVGATNCLDRLIASVVL
jgi:hypothetical protein